MRPLLLLLILPALLLAQPLPVAWPDRPAGTVLYALPTKAFSGASLPLDENHWLLAWCDMRDGQGRLMLQSYPLDNPSAGGAWYTQVEGLGPVDALVHEASVITPYTPTLASDGAGGAYVLWQEMLDESDGELRLQHVGPAGDFLWPADLVVAPRVPTPQDDCRDLSERCRSRADQYRRLHADGTGAWVVWCSGTDSLTVQHVEPGGLPDPDLPAQGLPLPISTYSFQLSDNGLGDLLLCYTSGSSQTGYVLGIRPDGQWLTPAPVQITPAGAVIDRFACSSTGDGRLLAAWRANENLRVQLLDSSLLALWPTAGVTVANGVQDLSLAKAQAPGPPYSLAYSTAAGWQAQRLDGEGRLLWAAPPWLDLIGGGNPGQLRWFSEDDEGIVYLQLEDETQYLQRLSPTGTPLWSAETARFNQPGNPGAVWDLQPGPAGEVRVGWRNPLDLTVNIVRRDLQGQDLLTPEQAVCFRGEAQWGGPPRLIHDGAAPLFYWSDSESDWLQSVDGQSGERGWGVLERPMQERDDYNEPVTQQTADGVWILQMIWRPETQGYFLGLQRLGADGSVLTPLSPVNPAMLEQTNYAEYFDRHLAAGESSVYVGYDQWSSPSTEMRLQRLDREGHILWGDNGLLIPPPSAGNWRLAGLAPAPDGVFAILHLRESASSSLYLQLFDEAGLPQYSDQEGRGRRLDLPVDLWGFGFESHVLDAGHLLLTSFTYDTGIPRLSLLCLDSQGEEAWSRFWAPAWGNDVQVQSDPLGRFWLACELGDESSHHVHVERLAADGGVEQVWQIAQADAECQSGMTLVHTETEHALLTASTLSWSGEGLRVKGRQLVDGQSTPADLFNELLTPAHLFARVPQLTPAPEGDAWLAWYDGRGEEMGYGSQARVLRLDVLDAGTAVDDPAQPAAFRLEPNRPNPFNPETTLRFTLAQAGPVRLEIFNLAGQRVRVLQNGELPAGAHSLRFDARDESGRELGSGLYFQRLSAGGQSRTQRMLLLR
ncbi:MAG: FlgD immunoglobulin-like domain containing protein [Candidatus Delongbacteria bacterium]